MADIVTLDTIPWRLGAEDYIEWVFEDRRLHADLSSPALSCTIAIYDSVAGVTLAATAMTMSGTTRRVARYFLTSGAAKTITVVGQYTLFGLGSWSDGTNTLKIAIQQKLDVRAASS